LKEIREMKISVLPVSGRFQTEKAIRLYPYHNIDYGVEQDFFIWIKGHPELLTNDLNQADWHYLPIYWTRWYFNHKYGSLNSDEIQSECDRVIIDDKKTFTIVQFAGGVKQKIGETIQFQSSPFTNTEFIIPELSLHPGLPLLKPQKKFKASFVGRVNTHPLRADLRNYLLKEPDIFFYDGERSIHYYTRVMLRSYISLCPRGFGLGTFRLFESLFTGVTPLVFGNIDSRPFKKWIDWDNFSFFTSELEECLQIIRNTSSDTLIDMGKIAKLEYSKNIDFQKWCKFVLMELEDIGFSLKNAPRKGAHSYIEFFDQNKQVKAPRYQGHFKLVLKDIFLFFYRLYKKSGLRDKVHKNN